MTVRQLRENLDSREFTQWRAFHRVYPIGEERGDLRAGIIAATIVNMHRDRNSDRAKPSDYMWQYQPEAARPQTDEEIETALDAAMAAMM
jgi:hypothetical protein